MVERKVRLEFAEVPGFVGWGWPPALPCSDMTGGVIVLTLDSGLILVQ